jgi:head-tail adaptor
MPLGRQVLSGRPRDASGQRYTLVAIEQLTSETSGGFPVETWTTLDSWWVNKRDLRADERFVSNRESAFAETQWHGPYRADMDPDLVDVQKVRRLVYQGRTHDIVAATRIERRAIELLTLVSSAT